MGVLIALGLALLFLAKGLLIHQARASVEAELEGRSTFTHRGFPRPVAEIGELARPLQADLERESAWRDAWDERVAAAHARMALELDARAGGEPHAITGELQSRYSAHLAIQQLCTVVLGAQQRLESSLAVARSPVAIARWQQESSMAIALEARAELASALERASVVASPRSPGCRSSPDSRISYCRCR